MNSPSPLAVVHRGHCDRDEEPIPAQTALRRERRVVSLRVEGTHRQRFLAAKSFVAIFQSS